MIGQKELYEVLRFLNIDFHYDEHPEAPTIEIAMLYWKRENALHCKNLFFRNHKGNKHYLVLLPHDQELDITKLEKLLHQGKLSFASEARMEKYLGLRPGSVSPFGLINDSEDHVFVYLDENLKNAQNIAFHPNDNRATLSLSYASFIRFLDFVGNTYVYIQISKT